MGDLFSPNTPGQPNLFSQGMQMLGSQLLLAPSQFNAQAAYSGPSTSLTLEQLNQLLMGTPAGTTYDIPGEYQGLTREDGKTAGNKAQRAWIEAGRPSTFEWNGHTFTPQYGESTQRTVDQAQSGLLDMYTNHLLPAFQQASDAATQQQAQSALTTLQNLGPQYIQAIRNLQDPSQQALLGTLNRQAQEGLDAGTGLTPSMQREVQNYVRSGQAARGAGYGNQDVFTEAMSLGSAGENRQRQSQAFAQSMLGANQAIQGDPFQMIFGRPSGGGQQAAGFLNNAFTANQQARGQQPNFDPYSSYGQNYFDNSLNSRAAASIAGANNTAAVTGSLIGSL